MPEIVAPAYVVVAGITLATPAVLAEDISDWLDGPEIRGGILEIPHRHGGVARPHFIRPTRKQTPIWVFGEHDADGEDHEDPLAGLEANVAGLVAAFDPRSAAADGTVAVELHLVGATYSGRGVVSPQLRLTWASPTTRAGIVDVVLPDGMLEEVVGS